MNCEFEKKGLPGPHGLATAGTDTQATELARTGVILTVLLQPLISFAHRLLIADC